MLRSRNTRRRRLLLAASGLAVGCRVRATTGTPLRFGTTPVFLDNQLSMLGAWQAHLEAALLHPVQFVQRGSYREISDLLLSDGIDVAWVCGFPYIVHEARMRLLAVPVYKGQPLYRSHLVVPSADSDTHSLLDLRGRVFAYSDPQSNSGFLVPRVELIRGHESPDAFFRRSFFTFGHRKVVEAVRVGLAQAGSVDGYVWDTLRLQHPEATSGVRVAWRSAEHGFPPIVARRTLPIDQAEAFAAALMGMERSETGQTVLRRLNIDGFTPGTPALFESIRRSVKLHGATG